MSLEQYLRSVDSSDPSLVVVNRTAPRPLQEMLEAAFEDQPVDVGECELPDADDDVVVLVEDGEVVTTSPLRALNESILLVNSDLYRTGTRDLEDVEVPDVIARLDEEPFVLRGFPESSTEKLLLIVISRQIERMAHRADAGRLRTSFQRLSRIDTEQGTRRVYEALGASGVDTHVYGVPDWTPPADAGLTMHGGYTEEFRNAWFVVYVPPDVDPRRATAEERSFSALLALEREPGVWHGTWTYSPSLVAALDEYVAHEL